MNDLKIPVTHEFHVVLADDDPAIRFFVPRLLKTAFPQCIIDIFDDGTDALEHIERHGTDLLITDHKMRLMTGAEVIRRLQEGPCRVPAIMISSSDDAREEGISAGACAFLEKHEISQRLPAAVQTVLARAG